MKKTGGYSREKRRSKPKLQKQITLVRPERPSSLVEQQMEDESFTLAHASILTVTPRKAEEGQMMHAKGNTAIRGRSQRATQNAQQRKPAALITPQDFMYVKRDLITIGILTSIMMVGMLIFTFFLGTG